MTPEMLHPCAHRIALTYPFTEHCCPLGQSTTCLRSTAASL
ncbi:Uncharacterised protein [Klebsiella pneumoniae]|uniref:Uncharacterized protein n=1 Tax=Klebsiella pneumoniae TaxID=573 RepID=A0A4P0XXY4_KLEPN|nr:Uncharacterised protein [Klebsiella pneumoniae]